MSGGVVEGDNGDELVAGGGAALVAGDVHGLAIVLASGPGWPPRGESWWGGHRRRTYDGGVEWSGLVHVSTKSHSRGFLLLLFFLVFHDLSTSKEFMQA